MGFRLVHFSVHLSCFCNESTRHVPRKALTWDRKVDECWPLVNDDAETSAEKVFHFKLDAGKAVLTVRGYMCH